MEQFLICDLSFTLCAFTSCENFLTLLVVALLSTAKLADPTQRFLLSFSEHTCGPQHLDVDLCIYSVLRQPMIGCMRMVRDGHRILDCYSRAQLRPIEQTSHHFRYRNLAQYRWPLGKRLQRSSFDTIGTLVLTKTKAIARFRLAVDNGPGHRGLSATGSTQSRRRLQTMGGHIDLA